MISRLKSLHRVATFNMFLYLAAVLVTVLHVLVNEVFGSDVEDVGDLLSTLNSSFIQRFVRVAWTLTKIANMAALLVPLLDFCFILRNKRGRLEERDAAAADGGTETYVPSTAEGDGLPIIKLVGNEMKEVGTAPLSPRPDFLEPPTSLRCRQADVEPTCWSLTIAQWLRFVSACMKTPTWKALAEKMGGSHLITMCERRSDRTPASSLR